MEEPMMIQDADVATEPRAAVTPSRNPKALKSPIGLINQIKPVSSYGLDCTNSATKYEELHPVARAAASTAPRVLGASHRRKPREPLEQRNRARIPLDRCAMVEIPGQRAVAVLMFNLSEGGACLEWREEPPPLETRGTLIVDNTVLAVRVTWTQDKRVGLSFQGQQPEIAASVRRIISETGVA